MRVGTIARRDLAHRARRSVSILFCILLAAMARGTAWPQVPSETPVQVMERAHLAHGGLWRGGQIVDWVGQGQITMLGDRRSPFNFTLMVKGRNKVQLVITQPGGTLYYGTDGTRSWQRSGPLSGVAAGHQVHFIESKTVRSIARVFNHLTEGLALRDLGPGMQDLDSVARPSRIIETQEGAARRTRYYVDNATSLVTRLEFDTGGFYHYPFSTQQIPHKAVMVFSDYRMVSGVRTPFKIDIYQGPTRIEQMVFTSVRYNVGLADAAFRP